MGIQGKRWRLLAAATVIAGAVTPAMLRWLRRVGAARRAVDMRMTVVVERPVGEVFELCRDFENFPDIVNMDLRIEDTQDGRSHWAVQSPRGHSIEWDATVTKYVPNTVIAWSSVPASQVEASGLMRFAPLSPHETRVDISLTYLPEKTSLAEAIWALLNGSNAKRLRTELSHASQNSRLARQQVPSEQKAIPSEQKAIPSEQQTIASEQQTIAR